MLNRILLYFPWMWHCNSSIQRVYTKYTYRSCKEQNWAR